MTTSMISLVFCLAAQMELAPLSSEVAELPALSSSSSALPQDAGALDAAQTKASSSGAEVLSSSALTSASSLSASVVMDPSMDPNQFSGLMTQAFHSKDWSLLTAIVLMFLVFIINKVVIPRLESDSKYKDSIPFLTVALSVLSSGAAALANKSITPQQALVTALTVGLVAIGSFEILKSSLQLFKKDWKPYSVPSASVPAKEEPKPVVETPAKEEPKAAVVAEVAAEEPKKDAEEPKKEDAAPASPEAKKE